MKQYFYLTLCMCLLLLTSGATAQKFVRISGRITDIQGEAVPGAGIFLQGLPYGTVSHTDGSYTLNAPQGRHTVEISLLGFETVTFQWNARRDTVANIQMKEKNILLESAEIQGKSKNRQIQESAFQVNAIDVKTAVNRLSDLSRLADRSTGVRIRQEGGIGSEYDLSLNGMSGNSVRYFIDEVPLDIKGSGQNLANIPVNTIERIEVYKGVVPSWLGADALGGAINIVTRKEQENYLDASYSIGSFHTHLADLNARYRLPRSGIILKPSAGIRFSKNDYTMKDVELWNEEAGKYLPTNVKRFHDDYLSIQTQLEAGTEHKSWADAFYVSGSWSKTDKEIQTGTIQSIVYGKAEQQQQAWNVGLRYRKNHFLCENLLFSAVLSHTHDKTVTIDTAYRKYRWDGSYINTSRNEITGRSRQMRHYIRPLTVGRFYADYRPTETHGFNLNYMLMRNGNKRSDETDEEFVPSNDVLTRHITGFSYNPSLFGRRMANTLFVKSYVSRARIRQTDLSWITHSDQVEEKATFHYWGYGAGSRYQWAEAFAVKASFEHAVRMPSAKEWLGNGSTIYPNLTLRPEQSDNFNAGIFGTLHFAGNQQLSYEAGGFLRKTKDYIFAQLSESDGTVQYRNISNVDIKGAEGEIRYRWGCFLRAVANCSYEHARNMNPYNEEGKPSVIYKNKIPNRPWLFGNSEITFTGNGKRHHGHRIEVSYLYQYIHWFFLTWEGFGNLESKSRIPTQHRHSVAAVYSWADGRYNVSATCDNLFDSKQYDNFMLQKPGRSFSLKFRVFIK